MFDRTQTSASIRAFMEALAQGFDDKGQSETAETIREVVDNYYGEDTNRLDQE